MHARVSWIEGQADRVDDAIKEVKEDVVPQLEQQNGFKGFTLFVDRENGFLMGTSYWESAEAMEASEEVGNQSREKAGQTAGAGSDPRVSRFEVAIDTMA
jgi:heme-degrading monooxygenase HmoA